MGVQFYRASLNRQISAFQREHKEVKMIEFLLVINFWAVLVSAVVYWVLGLIWFSLLFGKRWAKLIEKHGIKIKKPTSKNMVCKSTATLILNFIIAFGIAVFVVALGVPTVLSAVVVGGVIALCFSVATLLVGYIWESRPAKLILIDIGYPFIGIMVSSFILTFWR